MALRYEKEPEEVEEKKAEQYRLFATSGYTAGAENLMKEANNDAMPAYNLNCRPMLVNREEETDVMTLRHTTLATARLRFPFVAAKIRRHAGTTGVSYSDHYQEKGPFQRMMDRLRRIGPQGSGSAPVIQPALC